MASCLCLGPLLSLCLPCPHVCQGLKIFQGKGVCVGIPGNLD